MTEVKFLFDNQLIAELENLIKNSKHRLLLISPFIDLDKRIQDALHEKINNPNFELLVLFGKNEDNLYRSIKRDSFNFLKQFPNVEIRYNERLHAKFYQNDFQYIMTSLNLYDFSLSKNIEAGIIVNFASKGLLGRAIESSGTVINQGIDKVSQDVFGMDKEVDPIEKFQLIYDNSELKYKTQPIKVEKDGIMGVLGGKKLNGFNVVCDHMSTVSKEISNPSTETVSTYSKEIKLTKTETITYTSSKTQSASQLSKLIGVGQSDITHLMQKIGFIEGDKITALGLSKGLVVKNYMGKDYIAYPVNLPELNELK